MCVKVSGGFSRSRTLFMYVCFSSLLLLLMMMVVVVLVLVLSRALWCVSLCVRARVLTHPHLSLTQPQVKMGKCGSRFYNNSDLPIRVKWSPEMPPEWVLKGEYSSVRYATAGLCRTVYLRVFGSFKGYTSSASCHSLEGSIRTYTADEFKGCGFWHGLKTQEKLLLGNSKACRKAHKKAIALEKGAEGVNGFVKAVNYMVGIQ